MRRLSKIRVIFFLILLVAISSFILSGTIDITKNWRSKTCPIHNEKLIKGHVDYVVGGDGGNQPDNSSDYKKPPYKEGEFPNAKFNYYGSSGCIRLYDYAIILYCQTCDKKKRKAD